VHVGPVRLERLGALTQPERLDGRRLGLVDDGWGISMDLRLAVFERIAADDVLRRLLVNYADRLDDLVGTGGPAINTCYLTLQWSPADSPEVPHDAESMTVRAHMPRSRADEHWYLDAVLGRLDAALEVGDADGAVSVLPGRSSSEVVESGADTIFKSRTYDVAPLPTPRELPFRRDPGTMDSAPPKGTAPGHR
jgi:hypothetical protein